MAAMINPPHRDQFARLVIVEQLAPGVYREGVQLLDSPLPLTVGRAQVEQSGSSLLCPLLPKGFDSVVVCADYQRLLDLLQLATKELYVLTRERGSLIESERNAFDGCLRECQAARARCDQCRELLDAHAAIHGCVKKIMTA